MSYFAPSHTNHRRARNSLMQGAMARMADAKARRAVEGVTHILKGATYLPDFDLIPLVGLNGAPLLGHVSEEKARGLRKGILWATTLKLAGIGVGGYATTLPPLQAALVTAAAKALNEHLTGPEAQRLVKLWGLPIIESKGTLEQDIAIATSMAQCMAASLDAEIEAHESAVIEGTCVKVTPEIQEDAQVDIFTALGVKAPVLALGAK